MYPDSSRMAWIVNESICSPEVARSPLAASWTACWNFWRSRLSSSTVSVPTIERSEPSSTFLTIESTASSCDSRKRSAALRMDSSSAPILNVATPWTATLMPWRVTASARFTLIWRAVSLSLPTLWTSGRTMTPPPRTTLRFLRPSGERSRWPLTTRASLAPATL